MRKTRLLFIIPLVIALVALSLVGACAKPEPTAAKVLKFGAPGPLSGLAAGWGIPEDRGLRMLADEVNAEGGLKVGGETYTIEIISADTKFSIEGAAAASHKLAYEDGVKYAIGGIDKHETLSLQAVFEPAGVIHFHDGWGAGIVNTGAPHSFRIPSTPHETTPAVYAWIMKAYPNVKRVGLVGAESEGGHEFVEQIASHMPTLGLEVAGTVYYAFDAVEFYPIITKLLKGNPDIIDWSGTPPQIALFAKQCREKGYQGLFLNQNPVAVKDLVEIGGTELMEGFLSLPAAMVTSEAKAFQEAYIAKHGKWESNVLDIAISFQIIIDAMKKADSVEVDKVLAVLHTGGPFDTIIGPARIGGEQLHGIANQAFIPLGIIQIQDGVGVTVHVITADEQVEVLEKWAGQ